MRLAKFHNTTILKSDLDTNLDIKLTHKLATSFIESSSKVHKPKTYDKIIDNLIYKNKLCKAIDKELWNLDSNYIWYYKKLLFTKKKIRCK